MAAKKSNPKKVAYLWGAGATHAEAQHLGSNVSLLMRDSERFGDGITTRILKRTGRGAVTAFGAEEGAVDIEKLISLLAASGNDAHSLLAEKMRKKYFMELRESLDRAKILSSPDLAISLFGMHNNAKFKTTVEILSGIITTNHDGLLQLASQKAFGSRHLYCPNEIVRPNMASTQFCCQFDVVPQGCRIFSATRAARPLTWSSGS